MSKPTPPVPPAARSNKGPHAAPGDRPDESSSRRSDQQSEKNLAQQDKQGNIKQNTTNQGYQQDR
jgi:hypothetical protein